VVDFALGLPGMDPARLALMGLSFGGFLAPRAMAFEKRIKRCITNPGVLNWGQAMHGHFSSIRRGGHRATALPEHRGCQS
jgi:dipeptidyl aminopeptidase/acylaminoacyl peptidase